MRIKTLKTRYNNPFTVEKINEVIDLLDLSTNVKIIDFGGGDGEILMDVLRKGNAEGILVEIDKELIESCRKNAADLIQKSKLALEHIDAKEYLKELSHSSIDCIICIGSTHAFGNYLDFIKTIKPYLKPNGKLIIGEGFWATKPNQEYLELLGAEESELMYHYENIEEAEKLGLTYLYSCVASEDDWNRWEGTYFLDKEMQYLSERTPEGLKKIEETRSFRRAQIKYGRKMMGFGLYLFSNDG